MDTPLAEHVVDALIGARLVDPSDRAGSLAVVADALDGNAATRADDGRRRGLPQLVEVVAYLGAALVLAAGALFLLQQWGALAFPARVALLAVVTAVLLVSGSVVARMPADGGLLDERNDVHRRLAGSLLTFAGVGAAFLVGLVVDHAGTFAFPEVFWPQVAGALAGVVVGAVGYRVVPTALGLVATIGGAVTATLTLIDGVNRYEGDAAGIALLLLGAVWLALTERHWFRESTVARSLGLTVALVGAQVPVMDGTHSWLGYVLTVVIALVALVLYLARLSWPYLAAGVLAVTLVVPEAVSDWTDGSLGAVGGVLVAGATLLVASFAGFRIRAQPVDRETPSLRSLWRRGRRCR